MSVDNVGGPVDASSGNGDIDVTTAEGPVKASSGSGDITVAMQRMSRSGDLEFSSGNGRLEITLPANFGADVDATTGSGSVETDFPITFRERPQKQRLRGTIGDGGRRLRLSTGNGSVEIRRAAS